MLRHPRGAAALIAAAMLLAGVALAAPRGPKSPPVDYQHPPVTLLEKPVRVTAQVGSGPPDYFTARIGVTRGADRYELTTLVRPDTAGDYDAALAEVRRSVGWKGEYLFVATNCGSGNSWKCSSEAVFMVVKNRLVGLGTLATRERGTFGTSLAGRAFRDLDCDFEFNDLTSHATAPGFEVVLRQKKGALVGDRDSTWSMNAARFALNDSLARTNKVPEITGYRRVWDFVVAPRVENMLIATWCGRTTVADSVTAEARRTLAPELMVHWNEMRARVEPGGLPRRSRLSPAAAH